MPSSNKLLKNRLISVSEGVYQNIIRLYAVRHPSKMLVFESTISRTRAEAITKFCKYMQVPKTKWKSYYKQGYKTKEVSVTWKEDK